MAIRKRVWKTRAGEERSNWQLTYKAKDGRRRTEHFDKKKLADARAAEVKAELMAGTHTPRRESISVKKAGGLWLARAERDNLEPTTVEQYEGLLRLHIVPHIGWVRLADLNGPAVATLDNQLHKAGVSPEMRRKVMGALSSILALAVTTGHVARNVAKGYRVKTDKRGKRRLKIGVDVPDFRELEALLGALGDKPTWHGFVLIAAYTGMRASELRGLRWSSVDWDRRTIHVCERADKYGVIGNPKSEGSERDIYMPGYVLAVLQRLWKESEKDRNALVFPTRTGRPHNMPNIHSRIIAPAMLKAGLADEEGKPKYSAHSLRHYFASWAAARVEDGGCGLELREVQQLLGHATLALTSDTYSHFWPTQRIAERMRAVEQKMIGATQVQHADRKPLQIEA